MVRIVNMNVVWLDPLAEINFTSVQTERHDDVDSRFALCSFSRPHKFSIFIPFLRHLHTRKGLCVGVYGTYAYLRGSSFNLLRCVKQRPPLRALAACRAARRPCIYGNITHGWGFKTSSISTSSYQKTLASNGNDLFDSGAASEAVDKVDVYESASTYDSGKASQQSQRIHILGVGNVGTFVAHSLAGIPNRPPITLLLKGVNHFKQWKIAKETLSVTTRGMTEERGGFDIEMMPNTGLIETPYQDNSNFPLITQASVNTLNKGEAFNELSQHSPPLRSYQTAREDPAAQYSLRPDSQGNLLNDFEREVNQTRKCAESKIYHLIVCTRAVAAAHAVKHFAHRLGADSSILFLQNGIGLLDEVNQECFPDPLTRPQYLVGVNTHGLRRRGMFFDVNHVLEGSIAIGTMPQPFYTGIEHQPTSLAIASPTSQHLIRTMTRTPTFVCARYPPTDLFQLQLDKLVIDSVVGPLTTILDVPNGAFNESYHLTRILRLVLAETCHVIRNLPELKNVPNVNMRYDTARVEKQLWGFTRRAAEKDSTMLQDFRNKQFTDINFVNGYIIKRGEQMGMYCVMNYMLKQLVKVKCNLSSMDRQNSVPLPDGLMDRDPVGKWPRGAYHNFMTGEGMR